MKGKTARLFCLFKKIASARPTHYPLASYHSSTSDVPNPFDHHPVLSALFSGRRRIFPNWCPQ